MKAYGVNDLRRIFLEFFESKDHLKMNSFSLVPHNDKSLLLINSGMAPLKPYFTGQEIPPRRRMTTCQKCIRTNDIENVGKTARHGSFFEMLGNFSFGDYFKHEAIAWSWEFLTKVVGLEEDKLYPSVYVEDEEAFEIWNKEIGIDAGRIARLGKEENFWEHGAGPCGPSSEIYYDRGIEHGCGSPDCKVGCECDRFMEIWNNVFTQFEGDGKGNYTTLEHKNIDTGMGLERLASVVQNVDSIFDIDTIKAVRDKICEMSKVKYKENEITDISIRKITDHIRSITFMTADGVLPSNEGRGYVLRRLLRRAVRHGMLLKIQKAFLSELAKTVIAVSKDGYPELEQKQDYILQILDIEEEKFEKTIHQGFTILDGLIEEYGKKGIRQITGEDAFRLYDTYGFPIDLTIEILSEKGYTVDEEGFKSAMQQQKETAQKAHTVTNYMGADATVYDEIDVNITTEFIGYDKYCCDSKINALTSDTELVGEIKEQDNATIIVEETPFYAAMGGQTADTGRIYNGEAEFVVKDTIKLKGSKVGHIGTVIKGSFQIGDAVTLYVDEAKRNATGKNHSATHLLQKALRMVLGSHVEQAGSLVTPTKLRFDFMHYSYLSLEQIAEVEKIVNAEIAKNIPVETQVMGIEEAKKSGAMALFGEKYGESVRVVSMGDFSKELCGGTHVQNTGAISAFKIISETSIAAGVRRIEALTSQGVYDYYNTIEKELQEAAKAAKTEPGNLIKRIEAIQEELKSLQSENERLKSKLANSSLGDVMKQVVDLDGVKLLAAKVPEVDMNGLRNLGDQLKEQLGEGVVLLVSSLEGKVNLLAMATDTAVTRGAHAGNLIKVLAGLIGGGGGGRPNMAQAGGKNPAGMDAVIAAAENEVKKQIK